MNKTLFIALCCAISLPAFGMQNPKCPSAPKKPALTSAQKQAFREQGSRDEQVQMAGDSASAYCMFAAQRRDTQGQVAQALSQTK